MGQRFRGSVAKTLSPEVVQTHCNGQLMEEWGFVDDRELDSFKGHRRCATCDHFGYVTLGQCQVLGSCHLRGFAGPWSPLSEEL